jgi:hypothetical protein
MQHRDQQDRDRLAEIEGAGGLGEDLSDVPEIRWMKPVFPPGVLVSNAPTPLTQLNGCHNVATNQLLHDGGSHGFS